MLTEITAPTHCPECSTPVEEHTDQRSKVTTHWCGNSLCPGRLKDMLTFVADRNQLEIDGLGPELASLLVAGGFVTNLADLFAFGNEALSGLEALGVEKFAKQILVSYRLPCAAVISMASSLDRAKYARWDRWIAALGIPMIGLRMGKILAEKLELSCDDMPRLGEKLRSVATMEIEGIGPNKKAEIVRAASTPQFLEMLLRLSQEGVRPAPVAVGRVQGSPLAGVSFVITGELHSIGSRDYVTQKLVSLGATPKSGVTRKVTDLIVGSEPGATKLSKARELGIPTRSEDWVAALFEKHGFQTVGKQFEVEGI